MLLRRAEGLDAPPCLDFRVVAGQQHIRHFHAVEFARARVLRIFQQPVGERFLLRRFGRPQHPRNEPRHAVCQHHRRQFAAGEDVVADADFLVNAGVQRTLVNALVVAAEQHELLLLSQFAGDGG